VYLSTQRRQQNKNTYFEKNKNDREEPGHFVNTVTIYTINNNCYCFRNKSLIFNVLIFNIVEAEIGWRIDAKSP
jgi:hypothetical protein